MSSKFCEVLTKMINEEAGAGKEYDELASMAAAVHGMPPSVVKSIKAIKKDETKHHSTLRRIRARIC